MKNKRGILLDNVLGLIIAAIGIGLVIFAAYKLYSIAINQESENAKAFLNSIEGKINSMNVEESGSFQVRTIRDWFLVGWGKNDPNRIDKCSFESCICICKGSPSDLKSSCQINGFCRNFNFNSVSVFEFEKIAGKEIIDSNGQSIKEEDVLKDILNPKYYQRRIWRKGGIYTTQLLNNACPKFYESNLAELLIYKAENSLAVLKVSEREAELTRFEGACGK